MPTLTLSTSLEKLWLGQPPVVDPVLQIGSPEATYLFDEMLRVERHWPSHPQGDGLEASAEADIALEHYQMLHELGLQVVEHAIEPSTITAYIGLGRRHNKYIFAGSKVVEGARNVGDFSRIPKKQRESEVFKPLDRYHEWCRTADQAYVLSPLQGIQLQGGRLVVGHVDPGLGNVELGNLKFRMDGLAYIRSNL